MKTHLASAALLLAVTPSLVADMSPATWPEAERARLEQLEGRGAMSPLAAQVVRTRTGLVSATVSPIAAYAGVRALQEGGTAADAAATTALTQVTLQLGSVVSYAGIFTMLYYDAQSHQVHSLDAGYNSYLGETDPASIPVADLGPLPVANAPKPTAGAKGRETLVPGFMAGLEAMQRRFGRMPFRELFAPAIWYADRGVRISPVLQYYFTVREKFLARTPEGRRFLAQSGHAAPQAGDLFVQPQLAGFLRAVADQGSRLMYTGRWADDFVRLVQREGGRVTGEDLRRYRPIWSEPFHEVVFGRTLYANGRPDIGTDGLFQGLKQAEALRLDLKPPYWTSAETFAALARIIQDASEVEPDPGPKHSNAIVVVDREGNIAVVTHTINAVIWGDTGIVVDGVPIPDSAGFQQRALAAIKPGDRVPHSILDTLAFDGAQPVLATASIGSSLLPETMRVLLGVLGQRRDLASLMAAPPLIIMNSFSPGASRSGLSAVTVPQGAWPPDFIADLKRRGWAPTEVPAAAANGLRGTLAAVSLDPASGKRSAADQPGVMVFNAAEPDSSRRGSGGSP